MSSNIESTRANNMQKSLLNQIENDIKNQIANDEPTITDTSKSNDEPTITDTEKLSVKDFKPTCLEVFKEIFNKYKNYTNKDKNVKQLEEMAYADYNTFLKLKFCFETMTDFIKYAIIANHNTFDDFLKANDCESVEDLNKLKFQIPQTLDDLIIMYKKYPYLLELPKFSDLLFEIISIEKYPLLLRINKINPMLYFSIFPSSEDTNFIDDSQDDIESFYINICSLVKEILHINIKIAKTLYKHD